MAFLRSGDMSEPTATPPPSTSLLAQPVGRRRLLQGALALGGAAALGPFGALGRSAAGAKTRAGGAKAPGGYGPLRPTLDQTTGLPLVALPRGFEYLTFGRTGERMSDGRPTPGSHDGMGAFRLGDRVHLVRNHELGSGAPSAPPSTIYDPTAAGGTTTLVFDPDAGRLVDSYASLGGTIRNCAGGPTPEGTWLTCEETTQVNADGTRHGYVFEVPAAGPGNPEPIRDMGRFSHEATATDPATGYVYLTEDAGSSAIYRYRPADRANLHAGGVLEAMKLAGTTDTTGWATGDAAPIAEWVRVDVPDWAPGTPSCWQQVQPKGAAKVSRGEGAWYGNGVIYLVSTDGGPAKLGQVFALDPVAQTFTSVFTSTSSAEVGAPDNVCVSPRGGIVLCEDGTGTEYVHGLTPGGDIFPFLRNDLNGSEWAGATFEPKNGNWLFVNLQSPGITFAITGPWKQGAL